MRKRRRGYSHGDGGAGRGSSGRSLSRDGGGADGRGGSSGGTMRGAIHRAMVLITTMGTDVKSFTAIAKTTFVHVPIQTDFFGSLTARTTGRFRAIASSMLRTHTLGTNVLTMTSIAPWTM